MQDEPTPTELIKAVADFLRNEITPQIKGHNAFKLRVGINALDLVTRQLALEQASDAAEAARLKGLLDADGTLLELNRALAGAGVYASRIEGAANLESLFLELTGTTANLGGGSPGGPPGVVSCPPSAGMWPAGYPAPLRLACLGPRARSRDHFPAMVML